MATTLNGEDALVSARHALFGVIRGAERLAKCVEQLEADSANLKNPDPAYFYVPTDLDGTWGCTLDPEWTDDAPIREQGRRRDGINATLRLRTAVDAAVKAVSGIAAYMDSEAESVDRRWTMRTIGHLRRLRGAIVRGYGNDACPSALPMIGAGVPDSLREHTRDVIDLMEVLKSAILADLQPRMPTVSVLPDLVARLEAAAAAVVPHAIDRRAVAPPLYLPPTFVSQGVKPPAGDGVRPRHPRMDELCADPIVSGSTFRRIRTAAGIAAPSTSWKSRDRGYTPDEVDRLIAAVMAGNFNQRLPLSKSWAKFGTKSAPS